MTRHLIYGAGLIGGFLGGALLTKDLDVSFVARGAGKDRLQKGLILTSIDGHSEAVSPTQFVSDTEPGGPFDVIWLTVKATAIEETIQSLGRFLDENTIIICCQNGLGSVEKVQAAYPSHVVVKSIVIFNVVESDKGLHRATEGAVIVDGNVIKGALLKSLENTVSPIIGNTNIDGVIWAKLQLNLINAINAISNLPVKKMLDDRGYRKLYAGMMSELIKISDAKGITLERLTKLPQKWLPKLLPVPDWIYDRINAFNIDDTTRTSMWWDISLGRKTEIEFIQGALLKEAEVLGLKTPYIETIYESIKAIEDGTEVWGQDSKDILDNIRSR